MKPALPTTKISIDALRVGMYIHLDLGWMAHPFPLGSFRIASDEQIATIRSLKLKTVRWCPTQSDPVGDLQSDPRRTEPSSPTALLDGKSPLDDAALVSAAEPEAIGLERPPETPEETPEAAAGRQRREALAAQRQSLAACEKQFGQAASECRQLTERAAVDPIGARDMAADLTRTLVDAMGGDGSLCIRLLSEGAGDKLSAHAVNVTVISLLMGRVFGLTDEDMTDLGMGALLHDVGKIELAERVRHRDDNAGPNDSRAYEEHVARGVAIARKMDLTPGATMVIAQHHENADGTGFPLRLQSERMTVAARIVSLVNRYDKLCNPNITSKSLTPHESLSLLFAQGKNRFDTAILGAFIKMMGVYPPGSVVQLTDDRYALVVGVNSTRPLKPRVVVHEPKTRSDEALTLDLERVPHLGIRRSVRPLSLPREALDYLSPRWRVAYFFERESAPPARPVPA